MTKDEALKLALEALEFMSHVDSIFANEFDFQINAIKEALAQPEQEPVGWAEHGVINWLADKQFNHTSFLYDTPAQRTWVGLTDEEVGNLSDFAYANDEEFVRNVEKHLKEKNT
jgi:hypothetical protein